MRFKKKREHADADHLEEKGEAHRRKQLMKLVLLSS